MSENISSGQRFKYFEGWAVGSPYNPWIMGFTTERTRDMAKKKFEALWGHPWKLAYRRGFRLIRVQVVQS